MGINLLELVKSQTGAGFTNKVAALLGEDGTSTQKAMDILLPAVLGGITNQATTISGADRIVTLLNEGKHDGSIFSSLGTLLGGGSATQGLLSSGNSIVKPLFGDKIGTIISWVSSQSGIKSGSASNLMNLAAPLVLGTIGKQVGNNATASGLVGLLGSQLPILKTAIPSGIIPILGLTKLGLDIPTAPKVSPVPSPKSSPKVEPPAPKTPTPTSTTASTPSSVVAKPTKDIPPVTPKTVVTKKGEKSLSTRLLPWLVLLCAGLGGLYYLKDYKSKNPEVSETAPAIADAPKTDTALTSSPAVTSGVSVEKVLKLPEGEVKVMSGSFLDLLYNEIIDEKADLSKSLTFDNVNFAKSSTELTEGSKKQLDDLVKIMKAYPKVEIKIDGYTDSKGDDIDNKRLSEGRAGAVKSYLSAHNISSDRIKAAGFGREKPIASNETDEGRAKNRRIEAFVTKK